MNAICFFLIPILISCNNSNTENQQLKDNNANTSSITVHKQTESKGNGIVGDWTLQLEAYDDNHDHLLDDAERKKGMSNHYFYRFSADGSCLISPFAKNQVQNAFKGHYTIKEESGKKTITTYWDEAEQKGQREAQYTITSVNKDELILLETTGDHTFWIFKKQ